MHRDPRPLIIASVALALAGLVGSCSSSHAVPMAQASLPSHTVASEIAAILERAGLGCAPLGANDAVAIIKPEPASSGVCRAADAPVMISVYADAGQWSTVRKASNGFACAAGTRPAGVPVGVEGANWIVSDNSSTADGAAAWKAAHERIRVCALSGADMNLAC